MEEPTALALSKNVLAMKFMQRSRGKGQQLNIPELQTEEKWKYDDGEIPGFSGPTVPVVKKLGVSACRTFSYGRVSYQGFNEEIEKIMRRKRKGEDEPVKIGNEASVSDEAMASSLSKTVANKFSQKKRGKKRHHHDEGEDDAEIERADPDDEDEEEEGEISTSQRVAEIKRRVQELLGEDD